MECEICSFKNPKCSATAVIIKNNSILLLRRNEDPFKGKWDLPGGYVNEKETPKEALTRELKEELSVDAEVIFMKQVPGTASWKEKHFPIMSSFYLADIGEQELALNRKENGELRWAPLRELKPDTIAFDSNQTFVSWLKDEFMFDLDIVRDLARQLDPKATVREMSLYCAKLNGYVATRYEGEKLIGMGWIFPRQTMLRRQAVIEDMIVDGAYRGRGLGREILNDLVQWAVSQGVDTIELTSNPKRIAANELYKKYGFKLHPTNHYLYEIPQSNN